MIKSKNKKVICIFSLLLLCLVIILPLFSNDTNAVYAASDVVTPSYAFYGSNFSSYISESGTDSSINFKITLTQSGAGFFCKPSINFDSFYVCWSSTNVNQDSILLTTDSSFHHYNGYLNAMGIIYTNRTILVSLYCDSGFNCNVVRIEFGSSDNRYFADVDNLYHYYNYIAYVDDIGHQFIMTWQLTDRQNSFMFDERTYYLNNPNVYTSNENYQFGYSAGYSDGYYNGNNDGTTTGYDSGYSAGNVVGYSNGYNDGVNDSNQYSFYNLFGAVLDAPVSVFTSLFNFNLLGVNLLGLITGLFTLCVIVVIIKICLGGK